MPLKVWINGTFDVLHMGHIKLLQKGKLIGGEGCNLRVGVDTDERVQEKKGPYRPINTLKNRVEFLESIKYVDEVYTFSSDEELTQLIKDYKPDLVVIGEEYRDKVIVGKEWMKKIWYVPRYEDLSTTNIVGN